MLVARTELGKPFPIVGASATLLHPAATRLVHELPRPELDICKGLMLTTAVWLRSSIFSIGTAIGFLRVAAEKVSSETAIQAVATSAAATRASKPR